ncbi:MAG TPA: sugar phosphate nucleotidyltransferase [Candidatus Binatia bacterium]|nr:sugar phosphate nucleotidyltransferase [Candidatus Binatia bacterium]
MAGGSGTRFWPRSRLHAPKQLLPIVGARSMLAETVARVSPPVRADRVLVVTARVHARAVRAAVPRVAASRVLVEPQGRNTAPAIARAALAVARHHPDAVMAVLPADHAIGDTRAFRADLALALATAARTDALVTVGVPPTHPETGYGYIRAGSGLRGSGGRVAWVERFIEKPPRARAAALLRDRRVLWNAGIFAWRVSAILAALRAHLPAVLEPLEDAARRDTPAAWRAAYGRIPSVSIDTGVLERASRVAVVRARFPWSDVGSWAALEPFWRNGNGGNAVRGRALPIDSVGCVVDSPRRLVALVGVEDLVVVDSPDALLVCRKDRAQDVRLVVDQLRRRRLLQYL